jgi:hypothetical protein
MMQFGTIVMGGSDPANPGYPPSGLQGARREAAKHQVRDFPLTLGCPTTGASKPQRLFGAAGLHIYLTYRRTSCCQSNPPKRTPRSSFPCLVPDYCRARTTFIQCWAVEVALQMQQRSRAVGSLFTASRALALPFTFLKVFVVFGSIRG